MLPIGSLCVPPCDVALDPYQLSLAIEIMSRAVSHPPATATRACARNPHVLGAYFAREGQTGYQSDAQQPALHDLSPLEPTRWPLSLRPSSRQSHGCRSPPATTAPAGSSVLRFVIH